MMDQSAVRRWGVLAHDSFITTSLPAQHVRNYQDFFMLLLVSIQRQQATLIPLANCNCFTFVKNNQQIRNDCYNVFLAHKDQRPIVVWV